MRGPVLVPPCIRQRPFGIAGAMHADPLRVLAPHLWAVLKSPGGLPSSANLFALHGVHCAASCLSPPPYLLAMLRLQPIRTQRDSADDGLTAVLNGHMLHDHMLVAGTAVFL